MCYYYYVLTTLLCAQRREDVSCFSPELQQAPNAWSFSGGWQQVRLGRVFAGTAEVTQVEAI